MFLSDISKAIFKIRFKLEEDRTTFKLLTYRYDTIIFESSAYILSTVKLPS